MNTNYSACLAFTLSQESGWSDNPQDPGAQTMKGITLSTYRHYVGSGATPDDLHAITDAEVSSIYRQGYWSPVHGDDLPEGLDLVLFDMAANAGPSASVKLLQQSLGVAADGAIGPLTLAAIAAQDPAKLVNRLTMSQDTFYRSLPTYPTFGAGWSNRVEKRRQAALAMVQAAPTPLVEATQDAAAPVPSSGLLDTLKGLL